MSEYIRNVNRALDRINFAKNRGNPELLKDAKEQVKQAMTEFRTYLDRSK